MISVRFVSKEREQIIRCFVRGNFYPRTEENKPIIELPKVVKIEYPGKNVKARITFDIPHGLNPIDVTNRMWVFQQEFGDSVDLEQVSTKQFMLTVYKDAIPMVLPYDYEELREHLEGLNVPIIAGRSYRGWEVYDAKENPGLCVTGQTGSGKSTEMRALLTTLVLTHPAERLHLYLADLKRAEFHLFRRLPHTKETVVEPDKMLPFMEKIDAILNERQDLLDRLELTDVLDLPEAKRPPWILVCIDEFPLVSRKGREMQLIEKTSAIGRALGVFLILSMQRGDANILDGALKNNLTVRMAYRAADQTNYKITLGEEAPRLIKLTEKGRMWFKGAEMLEIQSPFLSVEEARRLLSVLGQKAETEIEG